MPQSSKSGEKNINNYPLWIFMKMYESGQMDRSYIPLVFLPPKMYMCTQNFVHNINLFMCICCLGLFTLLVYDFGVKNVEVEEVYDLSKPFERYFIHIVKIFNSYCLQLLFTNVFVVILFPIKPHVHALCMYAKSLHHNKNNQSIYRFYQTQ